MKKIINLFRKKRHIMVALSLLLLMLILKNNVRNIEETNYILNTEETENHILETDISIDDDAIIQQWYLENDGTFSSFMFDDEAWGFDTKKTKSNIDIDYYKGIQIFSQKRSVIVAVLDTEIDINHYALQDSIWRNTKEVDNDNIDNDDNGYIDDYFGWNFCDNNNILFEKKSKVSNHGTHITGILGGNDPNRNFRGMFSNSDIKIMCLKVLDEEDGKIENIIKAIEYAESNGALICCMAFSTYIDNINFKKTIENSKMLFVVPAGNYGMEINDDLHIYPASYDLNNIISVADIRPDGNLSNTSNFGKDIDIAAPGTDIVSTICENKYGYLCGTSSAVPLVAGTAALLYCHAENELTPTDIIKILKESSKKVNGLENKVACGGIVSLYNSLKYNTK